MKPKFILSIAGFDPSGKAGILRDAWTITRLNAHSGAIPTAITIQDFARGYGYKPLSAPLFAQMLSTLLANRTPDAVKIGMVPNIALADIICRYLGKAGVPIVYDPVLATSDGSPLAMRGEEREIFQAIAKIAIVVTPNIPEASLLSDVPENGANFSATAATHLLNMGAKAVIIKGAHKPGKTIEDMLFISDGQFQMYSRKRVSAKMRGTGCIFSSALARFLAEGISLEEAFANAEKAMDKIILMDFI